MLENTNVFNVSVRPSRGTFGDALFHCMTESIMAMKEEQKSLFGGAGLSVTTERNRIREGEQRRDPAGLAHSIQATAAEWRRQERLPAAARPCRVRKWEKPTGDLVKVNCDASYDPTSGNGGWGVYPPGLVR